jgi:ubiquinol-cytochrome c reductase cytochrome b subunit
MSFWAAKVITGFSVLLGPNLSQLVWGDLGVRKETLTFFFTLHFLLPLILFIIVIFHLSRLHGGGSRAPIQRIKITFSPTYLIKDSLNLIPFLFLFLFLGLWVTREADNFIRVDETTGPSHIKPE